MFDFKTVIRGSKKIWSGEYVGSWVWAIYIWKQLRCMQVLHIVCVVVVLLLWAEPHACFTYCFWASFFHFFVFVIWCGVFRIPMRPFAECYKFTRNYLRVCFVLYFSNKNNEITWFSYDATRAVNHRIARHRRLCIWFEMFFNIALCNSQNKYSWHDSNVKRAWYIKVDEFQYIE